MRSRLHLLFILSFLCTLTQNLYAQIVTVPGDLDGWGQTWIVNFNGSQARYNNWSEGGVNSISGTASTAFTKLYRQDRFTYGFRVHLRYGQSKLNGNDVRKNDDLISLRNRVTYELSEGSIFSTYGAVQFRTQFSKGFDYGKAVAGGDSLISGWFAPAYLIEGLGLTIKPSESFSAEIGAALKQTIVTDPKLYDQYRIENNQGYRSEGGLTFGAQYKTEVVENTNIVTSIETFTNLLRPFDETDFFWSNQIVGRINKFLNTTFQFELRYDRDYSKEIQLKQVFAAGIIVNIY